MSEELDDTRTAPPRASTSRLAAGHADAGRPGAEITEDFMADSIMADTVMADTVMTSGRVLVDLVEPGLEPRSRSAVDVTVRPKTKPPLAGTGIYSFRMGEHAEPVTLDRPARIGREPKTSRVTTGLIPRLVRVPSANHEVSATHLELRQVGSSVVVTDLRSTNGCVVMQPGSTARILRQGESVVVSPGALVDIGDGNILQILPMQRLG